MQVSVLFFASLREVAGADAMSVNLAEHADLSVLLEALAQALGSEAAAALQAANVRVAVNHALVSGPCALSDGDEIAFLPPVTGG